MQGPEPPTKKRKNNFDKYPNPKRAKTNDHQTPSAPGNGRDQRHGGNYRHPNTDKHHTDNRYKEKSDSYHRYPAMPSRTSQQSKLGGAEGRVQYSRDSRDSSVLGNRPSAAAKPVEVINLDGSDDEVKRGLLETATRSEEFIPLFGPPVATTTTTTTTRSTPVATTTTTTTTTTSVDQLEPKYRSAFNNVTSGPSMPLPPWASKPYEKGHLCLHNEIQDFVRYLSPTPAEILMRHDLVVRTEEVVRSVFLRCTIEVFGSVTTGLCLPFSDVDMVVSGHVTEKMMYQLAARFKSKNMCLTPQVITRARVPLVKIVDQLTGVQIDISFNQQGGPQNSAVVLKFCQEFAAVRPLTLLVKYFVAMRDLHEPYIGGLGSYAITLLVVSFLQLQCNRYQGRPEENLGFLLIDFLDFYGNLFNYWTTGISVRNGGEYFRKVDRDWLDIQKSFLLSLEDPNDAANDVGKSSFRILNIRFAFQEACTRLTTNPKAEEYSPTLLSRILQPNPLIEHNRAFYQHQWSRVLSGRQANNSPMTAEAIAIAAVANNPGGRVGSSNSNTHLFFEEDD